MCDLDRLLQGLYENFLFVRFRDSYFESVGFIFMIEKRILFD